MEDSKMSSIALTYAKRRNMTDGEVQFNKKYKRTETKEITLENLARKTSKSVCGQTSQNFMVHSSLPPVNQSVSECVNSFKKCIDVLSGDNEFILDYCFLMMSANLATVSQFESAKIVLSLIKNSTGLIDYSDFLLNLSQWNVKSSKTELNTIKSLALEATSRKKLVIHRKSSHSYENFIGLLDKVPSLGFIFNNYIELRVDFEEEKPDEMEVTETKIPLSSIIALTPPEDDKLGENGEKLVYSNWGEINSENTQREMLPKNDNNNMKKILNLASKIPATIDSIFSYRISGVDRKSITASAISLEHQMIAIATGNILSIFKLQKNMKLVQRRLHKSRISAVKVFGDRKVIVCDCEKIMVYKLNENNLEVICSFPTISDTVFEIKVNFTDDVFAVCGESALVGLYDLTKNVQIGLINAGFGNPVECIDFHPNGVYLACATEYAVRIFDTTTSSPIRVFEGLNSDNFQDQTNVIKFSSCGKYLFTGGVFINQLDVEKSIGIRQYRSHLDIVTDLLEIGDNSFNKSLISVSSFDNCIKCWHNDKLLQSFKIPKKTDILGVDRRKDGSCLTVLIF